MNVQVLGCSVDHVPCLKAWSKNRGGIEFPLLSDFWPHGEVAKLYSAFREQDGYAERAIFIIDKDGIIRYRKIHYVNKRPLNRVLFHELRRVQREANAPRG